MIMTIVVLLVSYDHLVLLAPRERDVVVVVVSLLLPNFKLHKISRLALFLCIMPNNFSGVYQNFNGEFISKDGFTSISCNIFV